MNRRMGFTAALAVLGVLVMVAGTALAQDVAVNYVPGTDFSSTRPTSGSRSRAPRSRPDHRHPGQAGHRQGAHRGWTHESLWRHGDLYVAYQMAITQERQWNTYNMGGPYAWRYGGGTGTATSSTIQIGTVALDMFDPAAKELVWKGQASKTLSN